MNSIENPEGYNPPTDAREQPQESTEGVTPTNSFPREYVLAVFTDLQAANDAADALRDNGFDTHEMHIMEGPDFVHAVAHDPLPTNVVTSTSHDMYLLEAKRGRSFVAIRPSHIDQLTQIRDVLAPHGAYFVRYIDTWSQVELLP